MNNNISFGASIKINDKAKCFSLIQRFKIKNAARKIGNRKDNIYLGTREYKTLLFNGSKPYKVKRDMILLSLIDKKGNEFTLSNNTIEDIIRKKISDTSKKPNKKLFNETIFQNVMGILKNINKFNENPLYTLDNKEECKEIIKGFKQKTKDFCSLKKTWHNGFLSDKFKGAVAAIKAIPPIEFPIKTGRKAADNALGEGDDIACILLKECKSFLTMLYK